MGLNSRLWCAFNSRSFARGWEQCCLLKEVPAAVFCAFRICFSLLCFPFVCQFLSVHELPHVTLSCLFSKEHDYCNSNDMMIVSYLLTWQWLLFFCAWLTLSVKWKALSCVNRLFSWSWLKSDNYFNVSFLFCLLSVLSPLTCYVS